MAFSSVTIHPALNMTTRLVGPPPQPTTRTPWPLRPQLSSQRWRPHARPVPPFLLIYNIIRARQHKLHVVVEVHVSMCLAKKRKGDAVCAKAFYFSLYLRRAC